MSKTQGGLPLIPLVSGFLGGLLVCLAIASLTNRNEAWDADLYYSTGIPVMCLIIFVLSFYFLKNHGAGRLPWLQVSLHPPSSMAARSPFGRWR